MAATPEEFDRHLLNPLDRIILQIGGDDFCPCTNLKMIDGAKRPCTSHHEVKVDKDGRSVFYFAIGCKVVETFCTGCLLYWTIAVARNLAADLKRVEEFKKAGR